MSIRQISVGILLLISLVISVLGMGEGSDSAAPQSKRDIIRIADKEVDRLGLNRRELDVQVDDNNRRWQEVMSILKESADPDARKTFNQYASKLQGKLYWTVFYRPKRVDGYGTKGGGATVLVDGHTGEVLIVIRGE